LYLPVAFPDQTLICITGTGSGSPDSIQGAAQGMGGNVSRCHRLACSVGSCPCVLLFRLPGGSMGIEGGLPDICHHKHPVSHPFTACFDSFPRSVISGMFLFKTGKDVFCTLCSPEGQYLLVRFEDPVVDLLRKRFVQNFGNRPADVTEYQGRSYFFWIFRFMTMNSEKPVYRSSY
jgi:hypothetical protein